MMVDRRLRRIRLTCTNWRDFEWRNWGIYDPAFQVIFHFTGWDHISLGFHVCFGMQNVELHLPFGFVKIGRTVPNSSVQLR